MTEQHIRAYYACFNERRVADAAALFTSGAIVQQMPFSLERGARAYVLFAKTWIRAFPDAVLTIEQITPRGDTLSEVDLRLTGTHGGALELGAFGTFKPTGARTALRMRELLDWRDGQIVFASLSVDVQDLVQQLTTVDYTALMQHLDQIGRLHTELTAADDPNQRREVTQRLGRELDRTRHVVRPYFKG